MSDMSVTFLGTSSGGGPSESRNCSSLVCDMLANQSLWMVDCAEGTTRQFALQPFHAKPHLRIQKIAKIFITHMHADHIMGIVPLLRNLLFPPRDDNVFPANSTPRVEIYGPAGLRLFVRQIMKMSLTRTSDKYVVHELLAAEDSETPCQPRIPDSPLSNFNIAEPHILHCSEVAGLDIRPSPDGLWRAITQGSGKMSKIIVDAGPILHRDPCMGYVFSEVQFPSRKLVILGDTHDPSAIVPLCINPPPSLLIHEATDSHISHHADPSGRLSRRTAEAVHEKALSRGHSVPEMAGSFAKLVNAQDLVLNHIGGRFPAPRSAKDFARQQIMRDIETKASHAWGSGKHVTAARDFMRIDVPFNAGDSLASTDSTWIKGEIEAFRAQASVGEQNELITMEYTESRASTSVQRRSNDIEGSERGSKPRGRDRQMPAHHPGRGGVLARP
ncbi:hypothetical protein GALMADRAFT_251075 [Galerina marginata CBS 339.88]|uniref:Metallo-beta-lactamase domain-containing protein n=1 Tax=Galerina marginata (strain CBS 339.88) TaxID=685588 RepID=A0A067T0H1_GALM3|nr:hypothetical protein GALMADRAFT_251075 [Galerina marginata CBS 339.88]